MQYPLKKFCKHLFVTSALTLLITSCSEPVKTEEKTAIPAKSESSKLAEKQELVIANGPEISSMDPLHAEDIAAGNIIQQLYEGLVNQDEKGNIVPGVALSWDTDDNKHFIFHLRKNAKWSNGEPVTAHDFEYALKRLADPKTGSSNAWFLKLTTMKNAAEITSGKKDKSTLGVKAIDDYTLKIELDHAVPYFPLMMAHTTMKPLYQPVIEKYGASWTHPDHIVTNGAYKLESWVLNERVTLVRNENYWDNSHTTINKVTFLPIEDKIAELNRYTSGEVGITSSIPLDYFKKLKETKPNELKVSGELCTYYYQYNTLKAPFDDVRVRQALSYIVDRDIMTDKVLGQGQKPAYGLTPEIVANFNPKLPDYATLTQKERNEKGKALLLEAGYSKENPLTFSLLYNTSENHKKIALAIGSMWKKTFGNGVVEVTLDNQEAKTYFQTRKHGDFQVARASWCGDYNEASTFTYLMQGRNVKGGNVYQSATYDKLVEQALQAKTATARQNIYYQQEALLAVDMPIIPIYQYVYVRMVSPTVGNFALQNAEGKYYVKDMVIFAK